MMKHLACIMDGNRRWAQKKGMPVWEGHRQGMYAAQRVIDYCLKHGIAYLSLYTFSLENFNRPQEEQHFLFNVLIHEFKERAITDLVAKKVRVRIIGDPHAVPASVQSVIDDIEKTTAHGDMLQLNMLFCYGGRQEIVSAIKTIVALEKKGALSLDHFDDTSFEHYLWTAGIPAPDLIVRTGGVQRLSNFLLFQAAYSELYFLDCYWPDLTWHELDQAIHSFTKRERNFGY